MADSDPSLARTLGALGWIAVTALGNAILLALAVFMLYDRLTFSGDCGEDCSPNLWKSGSWHLAMASAGLGIGGLSGLSLLLRRTWWPAVPVALAIAAAAVFGYQAFAFRG